MNTATSFARTALSLLVTLILPLAVISQPAEAITRTTTYTYHSVSKQIETIDGPRTDVTDITTYYYDNTTGNLTKIKNALGHETLFSNHDAHGRPKTITDPNGSVTQLTYHPRGWLTSRAVDGNSPTVFAYDNVGQLKRLTLPTGTFIDYTYDDAHRLTDITDNENNTIHYDLDPMGNRTKEETKNYSDVVKRRLEREYDQLNQLQLMISGQGHITRYSYDANGNQIRMTDPRHTGTDRTAAKALDPDTLDNTSQSLYDALNRLTDVIHRQQAGTADDVKTTYEYNALDQLVKVTDPEGLVTEYEYNALGDLLKLTSPDTGITHYIYDDAGNRKSQTDARNVFTEYFYDALNRLTRINYTGDTLDVDYTYDETDNNRNGIGRLTKIEVGKNTPEHQTTTYAYDKRGNLTSKDITVGNYSRTLAFTYNQADQLTGITYPSGREVTYQRNAIGQIDEVTLRDTDTTETTLADNITYAPFGPMTGLSYGNTTALSRSYDLDYRLKTNQQGSIIDQEYFYDATNNIKQIIDALNPNPTYEYDGLSRLKEANPNDGSDLTLYDYDKVGNRTERTVGLQTEAYSYFAGKHHLQTNDSGSYTYDDNGNTITHPNITSNLVYGQHNRLVDADGNAYTFNGKGERVKKVVGADITYFDYDPSGMLLAERDGSGMIKTEYVYLNGVPQSTSLARPVTLKTATLMPTTSSGLKAEPCCIAGQAASPRVTSVWAPIRSLPR